MQSGVSVLLNWSLESVIEANGDKNLGIGRWHATSTLPVGVSVETTSC